jgi:hypothetical protein
MGCVPHAMPIQHFKPKRIRSFTACRSRLHVKVLQYAAFRGRKGGGVQLTLTLVHTPGDSRVRGS